MPREQVEADIEEKVVEHALSLGALHLKLNVRGRTGWPDQMFLHNGKVLFLELKRPGEEPTKIQAHTHSLIRQQGGWVEWTDNLDEAKRILNALND